LSSVLDGQDSAPTPGALTRALLAAGVEPSLLQTAYERHRQGNSSFAQELSQLGVDAERALAGGLRAQALPRRLGDYELGAKLGAGGMGAVYRARHLPTGSERALKVLRTDAGSELVSRFQREAEGMAAAASHPHVVGIHAAGREGAWLWIALDLVAGGSLGDRLRQGPLPFEEARRILRGMAAGLSYAHEVGILHRDLKPENVLLDAKGEARLVDFGLARLTWQHSLTQTGVLLGTPAYMAPEQARGEQVDERADVYGLGGVLFHCLCGAPPFAAPTLLGLLDTVLTTPAPRVSQLRPDVPPELEALCASALAKDPAQRPPSAAAFLDALEGRAAPPAPPSRTGFLVGALALVVVGLALGAWLSRGEPPRPSPEASAFDASGLLARVYAGEQLAPAGEARLQRALDSMSRGDEDRRRIEFALALLRLEAGQKPLSGARSLNPDQRQLLLAAKRLREARGWRAGTLSELERLAPAAGAEAWLPRWRTRARLRRCVSLLARRETEQAEELLRTLTGSGEGEFAPDLERLAASQADLAATPQLLAELEVALGEAAVQTFNEARAWSQGGAMRMLASEAPPVVRKTWQVGSAAWRAECLLERPPRLPRLVEIFRDPAQVGQLFLPTKEHRQLQFEFFAPRSPKLAAVNLGFLPQVSAALGQAEPPHRASLAALLSEQLSRAEPELLLGRAEEILGYVAVGSPEASIVHENLGVVLGSRATVGEPDEARHLERAREHFRLARKEGHPNESHVLYQVGVISLRLGDPASAQVALCEFHDLTRIRPDNDDPWRGRRVYVLADCAKLLARTKLDSPAFAERAELAAGAARRFVRLPPPGPETRFERARGWHDATQVLRAGLVLFLAKDPAARDSFTRALRDHRTPKVSKSSVEALLTGRGSHETAWGMLRNEMKVATLPPYEE
jgi:protein kinase-like protein